MYITVNQKNKITSDPRTWTTKRCNKNKRVTFEIDNYNPPAYVQRIGDKTYQDITGFTYTELHEAGKHYQEFDIPKRNGKLRHIKAPTGKLKAAQAYVMNFMRYSLMIQPHNCCHGFEKGRSCKTAMQVHQANNARWFLKVDFSNFFPSIGTELLSQMFNSIANFDSYEPLDIEELIWILTDETGHLTQGCKSSPYISNLCLMDFDYKLTNFCAQHCLTYTRYADDMLISSPYKWDWKGTMRFIRTILPVGLSINDEKTQYRSMNWHNYSLGICYNKDQQLTVGHAKKNELKVICHKLELGQTEGIDKLLWKGRLNYYTSIEPDYFSQTRFDILRRI